VIDELKVDIASAGFMGHLFMSEIKTDKSIIVLTGSDGGIENAKAMQRYFLIMDI